MAGSVLWLMSHAPSRRPDVMDSSGQGVGDGERRLIWARTPRTVSAAALGAHKRGGKSEADEDASADAALDACEARVALDPTGCETGRQRPAAVRDQAQAGEDQAQQSDLDRQRAGVAV